jgi:hypothetical protein
MPNETLTLPAIALALALPVGAAAQTIMDVSTLTDMDDVDVMTAGGDSLGEIEAVLVDTDGNPVAVAVEVGGFLGIGDSDRVISMERLTWQEGNYTIDITEEEVEELPEWDD